MGEKIKSKLKKLQNEASASIQKFFSGRTELFLFLLVTFLFIVLLQVHFQQTTSRSMGTSYQSAVQQIKEQLYYSDSKEPLDYHYSSGGDVYCLFIDGTELFIKGNSVFVFSNNKGYYASYNKTIANDLNITPIEDSNTSIFFAQWGKQIKCQINAAESNGFSSRALQYLNMAFMK